MARRWTSLVVLVLVAALLQPMIGRCSAQAQSLEPGTGPLVLTADEITYETLANRVTARGNVELSQDGRTLLTEFIGYETDTGIVTARGNIILIEVNGDAFFGDELQLDDRLAEGFVKGVGVLLGDDTRIAAVQGVRQGGNRTILDRAVYSPCEVCEDGGDPLWQIKADRVVHDEETGTVAYRNARLELFGVPVAYTPYFYHPDPSVERRTGFLAPTFGSDSELGLTLETPFFIDIAPNRDLTLAPLLTTSAGPLLSAQYRELQDFGLTRIGGAITYTEGAGKRDSNGNLKPRGDEVRGNIDAGGRYVLSDQDRAGFNLKLASDDTFLQRYNISSSNVLQSDAYLQRFGNRDYMAINAYGFQSLRENDDQDKIPIALPLAEAELYAGRDRFGGFTKLSSSVLALTRDDGLDTRRFSTELGWQRPHIGPIGDVWSLQLALRGDVYNTDGNPQTRGPNGGVDTTGRVVPTANLDWSLPVVGQTGRWSHVIEPQMSFSYTPNNLNDEDIPNEDSIVFEFDETNLFGSNRFTGIDRVQSGATMAYGLNFDSIGPSAWKVAGLVGQSVRTGGDDLYPNKSGLEDTVSDIVGRVDVRPFQLLDVGYRFRLDKSSFDLRRSDLTLAFGPPALRFEIQYLRLSEEQEESDGGTLDKREEILAGLRYQVLDSLALGARVRRDLEEDRTVATQYGLVYTNPCLVLVAGLEQSFTQKGELDDEVTFTVRVTFSGLGDLGTSSGVF